MEAIKALLKQVTDFWAGRTPAFKRNSIIIAVVVLAGIITASVLFTHTEYAVLFSGLDLKDAGEIMKVLEDKKVAVKMEGDNKILVPKGQENTLRAELANEGYPKNSFNLDILDSGQSLTATQKEKQERLRYQIQYDIQSTLKYFDGVKDARVLITMPEDSPLVIQANKTEATAAVLLTLDDPESLTKENIKAMASLVQKSVPGLTMDNISIVDNVGNLLDFSEGTGEALATSDHFALQNSVQDKLQKQVMALLLPVFGIGKVQARVAVTLDFAEEITDSVKFEPVNGTEGVVSSIDKLVEQIKNGSTAGATGTTSNTGTTTYPNVNAQNGTYEKNAQKINYEINTIKSHLEKEKGAVKNLSVSVIIDNTDQKNDYSANVINAVSTAVGVDKKYVTVEYMPMSGSTSLSDAIAKDQTAQQAQAKSELLQRYIMLGVIAAVVLLAVFMVARMFAPKKQPAPQLAMAEGPGQYIDELIGDEEMTEEEQLAAINIVKDSETKEQIGKFIQTNPELAANLLRSWLSDE